MTDPNATLLDEVYSLRAYLALAFPNAVIETARPLDSQEYDILVEVPQEITDSMRGTYLTDVTMPVTVQQWCDSHEEAMVALETTRLLFAKGIAPGQMSRVPVWDFAAGEADVVNDVPIYFMRVDDVATRILPANKPTEFIAIADVRLMGWRVTKTYDVTSENSFQTLHRPRYVPPS